MSKFAGGRCLLMKTAQCAGMAAAVYPEFIKLMDKNNVPRMDRSEVAALLAEVLGMDEDEEPTIIN